MSRSIVDIKNMGDALRNTGYKNIESAVSEIIDNSVEAEAKNIFIFLDEKVNPISGRKLVSEIAFLDNGVGMDSDILEGCLGIGSTTRQDRQGMGRFGVGLPQASLYACPEIEVYSWQDGIGNCKKVFLNINKVKEGEQTELEDPITSDIPEKYKKFIHYKTLEEQYDFSRSGTLVIWKNCDRIQPKTRGPLTERLEFALGQKFRYFISQKLCTMRIICLENPDGAVDIYPNDPLFLLENNYVLGNPEHPGKAYIKKNEAGLEPYFEPYGEGNGEVLVPVKYRNKDGVIAESSVIVRFSIVKAKFYDETAIKAGLNPGSTEFGKYYASKMEGISVVRANREIDFRKFDFYENLNEPQHRWWGCEILFMPELDEAFGVANNKQYVELKRIEAEDIDPDEEIQPMWKQLHSVVANTIKAMYKKNEETRHNTRKIEDTQTAAVTIINDVEGDEKEDIPSATKDAKEQTSTEELINKGKEALIDQGFEEPTDEDATKYIQNSVNFQYSKMGRFGPAFDYSFQLGTAIVTINIEHELYTAFLNKIYSNDEVKTTFELFLAAFVKAVDETNYQSEENDKLVATWNAKLKKYIMEQLNPRKQQAGE